MTSVVIAPVGQASQAPEKKKVDNSDGMGVFPFQKQLPIITVQEQRTSTVYAVVIEGEINDIADFSNLIELFAYCTEYDKIVMQLFCPGGSMETTEYLCRRMDECAAEIFVEIGLTCASGASALAMHADDWHIYDSSTMMIHSCSYGTGYGKEMDISGMAEFTKRMNRDFIERNYSGFLTEQEMTDVLRNGHNLYFHADELRERFPKYAQYRAEQEERLFAEMQEAA